jgi:AcrR family transcriptional regulator
MAERIKTETDLETKARVPLSRERILGTAVAFADREGADSLSMRRLAQELGVVPMALYKHVANKDELFDGMIDVVVGEIDPPIKGADWTTTIRERILSARRALLRHPWASSVLESRGEPTPTVIGYMDSMMGVFLDGGFSVDLMHHAMHVMGSRILGFSQELFDDTASMPAKEAAAVWAQMADVYPNIAKLIPVAIGTHEGPVVGGGCDDQFEFEFALDLVLEGLERLRSTA